MASRFRAAAEAQPVMPHALVFYVHRCYKQQYAFIGMLARQPFGTPVGSSRRERKPKDSVYFHGQCLKAKILNEESVLAPSVSDMDSPENGVQNPGKRPIIDFWAFIVLAVLMGLFGTEH